jgi:hypothetical protein
MAQNNPIIQEWMKDKDSITQKQIGKNFIHYLGSQTSLSAIMLSLDLLVGDEFDKSPQDILETYDSRLQHSDFGWKWLFSNPTIPDFGCDKFWNISDQKKWHIKHSCGEIYVLDESCIDYEAEIFRCPKCKEEITDENRRMGEWVATAEGKWSGYWIPLWLNPQIKAPYIAEKKRGGKEYFYNFVAGLPYINTADMLSMQILEGNLVNTTNSQEGRIIIGIDTGHDIHYTLGNKEGRFFYRHIASVAQNPTPNYNPWDEVEKLLKQYPRSIAVIDQGGDLIGPRILQKKYPGRVYLCWFVKPTKNQELIRWVDEENGIGVCKVLVDRNRMIQESVEEYKEGRSPIQGKVEDWKDWFAHALNVYRVKETVGEDTDPQYGWRYVWKRKGPDHFFLSDIYFRVGLDRFANDLASIVHKDSILSSVPRAFNGEITTVPDTSYLGFQENI